MKFKIGNFEKQIHKVPKKVVWCKKCVMSNQRPRIFFKNGICSACINKEYKSKINWKSREKELLKLLDKHRSNGDKWDVIVPSSGGKDSGYVAHQLKYKYGMNPLTVTWSPLEYTDIGWKNLQGSIQSGLNNILYTPNGILHRKLARLSLEELGDAFHVFVLGQLSYPYHMAVRFGISLIFYGENAELEYAGDPNFIDRPFKPHSEFLNQNFKGSKLNELVKFAISKKNYIKKKDVNYSDLKIYNLPDERFIKKTNIPGIYFFSYYKKWTPQENYYYCLENTNFRPNPTRSEGTYSKYASLDDKMDGFHYYFRYLKFGLGRCSEDAAHEIRDGHITREEGVQLMKKYEGEFPEKYFKDFLNFLNIKEKDFYKIADSWRPKHLWKKVNNKWVLKFPVK